MKNVTDYKDKNVLVVGLGKSGLNSAYLLKRTRSQCDGK